MFGVANSTVELINGAPTANKINKIDITNMAVPAKPPITFKVVNPFVDNNKKTKKIIKINLEIVFLSWVQGEGKYFLFRDNIEFIKAWIISDSH